MTRVVIAIFAALLIVSFSSGILGLVVVFPIMAIITGVIAVPLFFVFRRNGWLAWWHAVLAGVACGAVFSCLFTLVASSGWVDRFGLQSALSFAGYGAATALIFWWLGLFKNKSFPSVPARFPYEMVLLVPVVALGVVLHGWFGESTQFDGRVISVRGNAPITQTTVRLRGGAIVEVPNVHEDFLPNSVQLLNHCWHLSRSWSTSHFRKIYQLESAFRNGEDDC